MSVMSGSAVYPELVGIYLGDSIPKDLFTILFGRQGEKTYGFGQHMYTYRGVKAVEHVK